MKVMQRGIMKILPGKMAEAMELNKQYMAIVSRLGMPATAMRMYRPFTGGGDAMHIVIFGIEWDSLTELAAFFERRWQTQRCRLRCRSGRRSRRVTKSKCMR